MKNFKPKWPRGYSKYDVFVAVAVFEDKLGYADPAIYFRKELLEMKEITLSFGALPGPRGYFRAGFGLMRTAISAAKRHFLPLTFAIKCYRSKDKD